MIFDPVLLTIFIVFALLGWLVSARLKNRFRAYSKIALPSGMSGKEVAEQMLRDHNIHDVAVTSTPGRLTDHYNPVNKTINLSPDVFDGRNISAAAVAAHETGHAVQHATSYAFLSLRSAMVPVVSFSSRMLSWVFLLSFLGAASLHLFTFNSVLLVIIGLQGVITLFSFITLPVELDASNRALQWLAGTRVTGTEHEKASSALRWAASTYIVAALGSLATLLYYIMLFTGRRD